MSADRSVPIEKYIHVDSLKIMREWNDLWFVMADMDASRYDKIKGIDVVEFWNIFDKWRERVEVQKEQIDRLRKK